MTRWLCRLLLLLAIAASAVVAPPSAHAQQKLRAAAVVNDSVISVLDLEMRMRLVILSSNLSDNQEVRQRIAPQVLRTLIDERLQLQEAERLGISISDEQIDQATQQVAQNNNMSPERFFELLKRNDILPDTFRQQIRSNIAWQSVIAREIRPDVQIGVEEIEEVRERLRAREGQRQLRVREIFLSTDNPDQSGQVSQTAQRLIDQLRQGADFAALARQFSQSATAATGGDLGWITPGSLPESVAETLDKMQPGQVAGPIRTYSGIYIVQLRDTRQISAGEANVELRQLFHPVAADAGEDRITEVREQLQDLAGQLDGCGSVRSVASAAENVSAGDLGTVKLSNLPEGVREVVDDLDIETPSAPTRVNDGMAVLLVCNRESGELSDEQIRENLERERINMLAQRYMRDLRRRAHVDIRL